MADEWFRPDSGASGLQALVARAVTLDAGAFARFRERDDELDVFVTTPFHAVVMRRIKGAVSRDGAVVRAEALHEALVAHNSPDPTPRTLPLGPPVSLMDQTVLTVTPGEGADPQDKGSAVEVPMRVIFTATSLGLIPGFSAPMDVPRYIRVSAKGRWLRLDAPFGTVYHSTGLTLI